MWQKLRHEEYKNTRASMHQANANRKGKAIVSASKKGFDPATEVRNDERARKSKQPNGGESCRKACLYYPICISVPTRSSTSGVLLYQLNFMYKFFISIVMNKNCVVLHLSVIKSAKIINEIVIWRKLVLG